MGSLPKLLDTFLRRWNEHDVEGLVALYAPGAEMVDPTLTRPIRGADSLRRYYATMWEETADARLECRRAEAGESGIAWVWRFSGSNVEGPWRALGASYFRLENGLISADHAVWDPLPRTRVSRRRSPRSRP